MWKKYLLAAPMAAALSIPLFADGNGAGVLPGGGGGGSTVTTVSSPVGTSLVITDNGNGTYTQSGTVMHIPCHTNPAPGGIGADGLLHIPRTGLFLDAEWLALHHPKTLPVSTEIAVDPNGLDDGNPTDDEGGCVNVTGGFGGAGSIAVFN